MSSEVLRKALNQAAVTIKLAEDRLDFLRQKYIPLLAKSNSRLAGREGPPGSPSPAEKLLLDIMGADPTAGESRAGNYTEWLLKQFLAAEDGDGQQLFIQDLPLIKEQLALFNRLKVNLPIEQRDINKHNVTTLWQATEELKKLKGGDARPAAQVQVEDQQLLYKDDGVVAIRPLSFKASRALGAHTRWCTSASGGADTWKSYNNGNLAYLVIFKFKNGFDAQLEVNEDEGGGGYNQLMDRQDRPIDLKALLNNYEGSKPEAYYSFLGSISNVRYHAVQARAKKGAEDPRITPMMPKDWSKERPHMLAALSKARTLTDHERQSILAHGNVEALKNVISRAGLTPAERQIVISKGQEDVISHMAATTVLSPEELATVWKKYPKSEEVQQALVRHQNVGDEVLSKVVNKKPGAGVATITDACANPFMTSGMQASIVADGSAILKDRLRCTAAIIGLTQNKSLDPAVRKRLLAIDVQQHPSMKPGTRPIEQLLKRADAESKKKPGDDEDDED